MPVRIAVDVVADAVFVEEVARLLPAPLHLGRRERGEPIQESPPVRSHLPGGASSARRERRRAARSRRASHPQPGWKRPRREPTSVLNVSLPARLRSGADQERGFTAVPAEIEGVGQLRVALGGGGGHRARAVPEREEAGHPATLGLERVARADCRRPARPDGRRGRCSRPASDRPSCRARRTPAESARRSRGARTTAAARPGSAPPPTRSSRVPVGCSGTRRPLQVTT